MKVVCINNINDRFTASEVDVGHPLKLSIGKIYTALNDQKDWNWMGVKILNDNGQIKFYDRERFKSLEEWRQIKLNELGI